MLSSITLLTVTRRAIGARSICSQSIFSQNANVRLLQNYQMALAVAIPSRNFGLFGNFRKRFRALAQHDEKIQEVINDIPEFMRPKDPNAEENEKKKKAADAAAASASTKKAESIVSTKHFQTSPTEDNYVFRAGMKAVPSARELKRLEQVLVKMEEERRRREMEANEDEFDFNFEDGAKKDDAPEESPETVAGSTVDADKVQQPDLATPAVDPETMEAARRHPHFGALVHVPDQPLNAVERFKSWISNPTSIYSTIREKCLSLGLSISARTNLMLGDVNILYPDFNIVRFLDELEKFHRYHIIAEANADIEFYRNYGTDEMVQIVEHLFKDREEKGELLEQYVIDVSRAELYGLDYIEEDLAMHITFEAYHTFKRLDKNSCIIEGDTRMNHVRYLSMWRMCADKPRLAGVHKISTEHIV